MTTTNATTLSLFLEVGRIIRGRMEKALPLSFGQCETLRFIGGKDEPTMQDLARHFKITAPSATSLVQELVRGGYVQRIANARDRRQVKLGNTRKGTRALKSIERRRKKVLAEVLHTLQDADRKNLNRVLEKIISAN